MPFQKEGPKMNYDCFPDAPPENGTSGGEELIISEPTPQGPRGPRGAAGGFLKGPPAG